jgi:hypothetical protein
MGLDHAGQIEELMAAAGFAPTGVGDRALLHYISAQRPAAARTSG